MKLFLNFIIAFFLSISTSIGQLNPSFVEFLEGAMIFLDEEINPAGLSISVRSGDDEWSGAIGVSSVEDSLTNSSILAMGSITKTIVSAGILKLMEEGRLTLNDPLFLYIPSFQNIDSTVTIKELLNHTSGIYNFTEHPVYFDSIFTFQNQFYTYSPEEILEQFVLEKVFERGTAQEYSNTNYVLLGMIITEIANRPFYEEIFELFNVEQNYPSFSIPPLISEISELADLWFVIDNTLQNTIELGFGLDGFFSSAGAAGAFVGTPSDLSQWGYDLYSGKLLSEAAMDSLFDFPFQLFDGFDYGLGVSSYEESCGVNAVGHNGSIFYQANLTYYEEYDLSIAVMTNDGTGIPDVGGVSGIADEIICSYEDFLSTSSEDISEVLEVQIYPNPAFDIINIDLPQHFESSIQVEVYNEIGSLVYSQNLRNDNQNTLQIDCFAGQARGFYFIKIYDKENVYTGKVIRG